MSPAPLLSNAHCLGQDCTGAGSLRISERDSGSPAIRAVQDSAGTARDYRMGQMTALDSACLYRGGHCFVSIWLRHVCSFAGALYPQSGSANHLKSLGVFHPSGIPLSLTVYKAGVDVSACVANSLPGIGLRAKVRGHQRLQRHRNALDFSYLRDSHRVSNGREPHARSTAPARLPGRAQAQAVPRVGGRLLRVAADRG